MNALRAIAVAVLALAVVVSAGYALFGFVLVSNDGSTYTATTTVDYDYDEVLAEAETSGYSVEIVDSSGYHPEGVDQLDAELGPNYEVFRVVFYHEAGSRLDATVFDEEGTVELVLFGPEYEPIDPDALPEDWMGQRIQLALGVDEPTARAYVDEMRASTMDDDVPIPQTYVPGSLQFEPVYAAFDGANRTVHANGDGQGWVEYHYTVDGERRGELQFVVERATITDRDGRYTYVLAVDRIDGVGVVVRGPADAERSANELRSAVRERFVAVGLPAAAVDDMTFEYERSDW